MSEFSVCSSDHDGSPGAGFVPPSLDDLSQLEGNTQNKNIDSGKIYQFNMRQKNWNISGPDFTNIDFFSLIFINYLRYMSECVPSFRNACHKNHIMQI